MVQGPADLSLWTRDGCLDHDLTNMYTSFRTRIGTVSGISPTSSSGCGWSALVDRLLDLLESRSDFKHFHLDGQTIVLEDYLELRPRTGAAAAQADRATAAS